MTKVKICGLRRPEDIQYANQVRPDYIGFVFAEKSRRYVVPEQAKRLKDQLRAGIAAVGVFVNAPVEQVAALLNDGTLELAQLHGQEDKAYLERLRELSDKPIIQAFHVESAEDVEKAKQSLADWILLDNGAGGTGQAFDWSLLTDVGRPFFLAGGLTADNVEEAIRRTHPFAVDTSSGVETEGVKDGQKMSAFVQAARGTRC